MRSKQSSARAVAVAVLAGLGPAALDAAEQMLRVSPSDGNGVLLKRFDVPAGTTILGTAFPSSNATSAFPEIALIDGAITSLAGAPRIASRSDVSEVAGTATCLWNQPIQVGDGGGVFYVMVRLPSGSGEGGPAIGAHFAEEATTSFLASAIEGALFPIRTDLAISLLTDESSTTGKASTDPRATFRTYLGGGRPNPSRAVTSIEFGVGQPANVRLSVYNIVGRRIRTITQRRFSAGVHYEHWDGLDDRSVQVPAGIYLIKLQVADDVLTQKLLLVK